jgi:4-diphosphocytidyl-2-C-methyl-D-erythritol kinase
VDSLSVATNPPAKLNLFLELHGKRSDGFHELETVMVAIDRCDYLSLTWHPEGGRASLPTGDRSTQQDVRLRGGWLPAESSWQRRLRGASAGEGVAPVSWQDDNLVVRALDAFRRRFGVAGIFEGVLWKRIPAGAGMGGASSDAASALLCAAALCEISASDPRLWELAAELGSDVPFFLGARGSGAASGGCASAALAAGRGERLHSLPVAGDWHWVVLYPPEAISTAECYRRCRMIDQPRSADRLTEALRVGNRRELAAGRVNRLTAPARSLSPWIDRALAAIRRAGLESVTMTGSGSACCGVARTASHARQTARRLASRGLGICFSTSPACLPARVRWID